MPEKRPLSCSSLGYRTVHRLSDYVAIVCSLIVDCLIILFFAEYVQLYVDFLLNKSIYRQFAAFFYGFHSVCASDALLVRISRLLLSKGIN